ncbi:Cation/H+ exchanger, partial [Gorgonomyces haynaldii]
DTLGRFFLQLSLILTLSILTHEILFKRLRMNLLTSQVCAGVILSLLSRLSGFQDVVMNKKSFEYLKLIALVGKNVYMFLIGLQLDLHQMWPSIYRAKFISMGGLLMPFAFGVPMAYLLSEYDDHEGHNVFVFYFFIGTCMAVTALPVLSHILAQEDLTETRVGETAISAAVTDDIISWIILAVLQTLASPSEASRRVQNVIYELLCLLAFGLFLHYLVKPLFVYLESHMNLDEYRVVIYMSLFVGAFFTQSIGINSFLGSFMVGLSMPHQSHFSHEVAESLEDLVQYFLIPIYFAYVGFYTRFDTFGPKEWGFTFLLVFMTFVSKTFGCAISSMRQNFSWRESLSIGIIMNSKGLIELVVLQLGLDLQIVDATVYSMFIFTMTVLTACTVPLTHLVYP